MSSLTDDRGAILTMVAAGTMTPERAAQMLSALDDARPRDHAMASARPLTPTPPPTPAHESVRLSDDLGAALAGFGPALMMALHEALHEVRFEMAESRRKRERGSREARDASPRATTQSTIRAFLHT